MAQDLLDRFTPLHNQPINDSNIATLVLRTGHRAIKFPPALNRAAYFASVMSPLNNLSGLKVTLVWTMPSASGGVIWKVAFERHVANVFNFATSSFAPLGSVTASPPTAANRATYTSLTFANGTPVDSIIGLDSYRMSVWRYGASDGVGDAVYLHRVIVQNAI
jgi:hypothetical protein